MLSGSFFDRILRLAALLAFCCCSGVAFAQTAAELQYETGLTSFQLKNYASAIDQWERLLTSYPDYAEKEKVWFSIASAAMQSRDNDKAITYYAKILDQQDASGQPVRGPYYEETLFQIGQTLFTQAERLRSEGDTANAKVYALRAKEFFDRLTTESPDSTNVATALNYLMQIAVIYMQNASETLRYAEEALAKIPSDTAANQELRKDCQFYQAWALGQLGRETEARRIFGTFIDSKDPKRGALSLIELAYTYYRKENVGQALSELQRFDTLFPNDTANRIDVWRLQAKCHFRSNDHVQAHNLMKQIIESLPDESVPVEDYVYLILCYMQLGEFTAADSFLTYLENAYGNTVFNDGIKVLRAGYYFGIRDYQQAVDLINPVLGMTAPGLGGTTGTVVFTRRPYNAETDDRNKCGLSEEHFLRAASLLAVSYARMGQRNIAEQVYNAMSQVTNELYGRYSSLREKTRQELNQVAQTQATTETGSGVGTVLPPTLGGTSSGSSVTQPSLVGSGTGNYVTGGSVVTASPTSTVQLGGGNSLAHRVLTPAEQDEQISRCETRAKNGYEDDVLKDLQLLLENRNIEDFNHARVALLRGQLLFKKGEVAEAVAMFELAYEIIPQDQRDTATFASAAYYLGKDAEVSGKYADAAKYYSESFQTTSGKGEFRSLLLYRWGTSQMNVPGQRSQALWCFEEIYKSDKASKYWSHAALQLAFDDYKNTEFDRCEQIVDEIIAYKPDRTILDRVLFLKGELALRNKRWDIAVESFDALCVFVGDSDFAGLANQKLSDARSRNSQSVMR